ncbi:hypothetical protein M0657_002905 [Pyricularia oryzae]|nr:hypothetical protein M9X92_003731 [Pyricularia oryzae]KAI7928064.1 hypothetical protein M0657_002905 [Pyricularia oryzae]
MVVYHEELCPEISSRGTALDGFHELQKEGETSFSLGAASHFPFASQFQPAKQFPNPALPKRSGFGLKGLDRCILMRGQGFGQVAMNRALVRTYLGSVVAKVFLLTVYGSFFTHMPTQIDRAMTGSLIDHIDTLSLFSAPAEPGNTPQTG